MKKQKISIVLMPVFWPALPPLSLPFLKTYLMSKGISVFCKDYNNLFFRLAPEGLKKEWKKSCNRSLEKRILKFIQEKFSKEYRKMLDELIDNDILGFSCFKSNFFTTIEIIRLLKEMRPSLKVIVGGPEITHLYFQYKNKLPEIYGNIADYWVVGEGEKALYEIITQEENPKVFKYREIPSLQDAILPDFEDFKLEFYPGFNAASLLFSKGCMRKCRFCSERLLYKSLRYYPVNALISQISRLQKAGVCKFVFHDSMLNADFELLEEFCDKVIENFGSIKWEAQFGIRPDMPDLLLKKIKISGCYHLFIGLESGSNMTLKAMNKGYTKEEAIIFFQKLNNWKLSFGISLLIGFPSETEINFRETLDFVIDNKHLIPKIEQINPFVHYPGTPLPQKFDYRNNSAALERTLLLIQKIKEAGIKHTNAYILNLVDH